MADMDLTTPGNAGALNTSATSKAFSQERASLNHLAATRSHDALNGATSLLLSIAGEMDRVGEEGASDRVYIWESAIRFIARALDDNAAEVWECLKSRERSVSAEVQS